VLAQAKRTKARIFQPSTSRVHEHIVHFDYPSIDGAFNEGRLTDFWDRYIRKEPVLLRLERERQQLATEIASMKAQLDVQRTQQQGAAKSISRFFRN